MATGRWALTVSTVALGLTGCMVGPNYSTPPVAVEDHWQEAGGKGVTANTANEKEWWKTFNDPALDHLISMAYGQNLELKIAGLRVLEARAKRGITAGEIFPQVQQLAGGSAVSNSSAVTANPLPNDNFQNHALGFDVFWEADVWGQFRRGIESSDASMYASIMNYDDVLVTLVSEVAVAYMDIRSLDARLAFARENVKIQQDTLGVVDTRFRHGEATELDFQQARSNLTNTEALVPRLQSARRLTMNRLCLLLGLTPRNLDELCGPTNTIPKPPENVAIGAPAELLRRRPDIRRAEREAAAQCARIGVAVSQLYPHFALNGSIGYEADDVGDMFSGKSFTGSFGPSFRWDIFNYGRIKNAIRVEDARFEQLIIQYQNTVLRAANEVESSSTAYIMSQKEAVFLAQSVDASRRATDLALTQYRGGEVDFIRVLDTQSFLADQQDRLARVQRDVAVNLITLHRALGGGWELHQGNSFVDEDVMKRMRERTDWGDMLGPEYPDGELIRPKDFKRLPTETPTPAETKPASP